MPAHRIVTPGEGQFYVIDNENYGRVSGVADTIPNHWLDRWRQEVGEEEADRIVAEAARWGSIVHQVTELNDKKKYKAMDFVLGHCKSAIPSWLAWVGWTEEFVKEWIAIERTVWSRKHRIAGTIDRVAIMVGDRSPTILDIKTGNIYEHTGIPSALYMMMWNERERRKVRRRMLVHLPRKKPGEISIRELGLEKMKEEDRRAMEALEDYNNLVWRE